MNDIEWVRPKAVPVISTILAVIIMFGLGAWQLHRLEWKQNIIQKIESSQQSLPAPLTTLNPGNWEEVEFAKVQFSGRPISSPIIFMAARYFRGELGYHVLIPMEILDQKTAQKNQYQKVLVNMGWIPESLKKTFTFGTPQDWNVWQDITGLIRIPNRKGLFTPDNKGDLWFWYDIPAMENFTGSKVLPIVIDQLDPQVRKHAVDVTYPVGFDGDIHLRNDHLQYAVTWFGIGVAALVIFIIAHTRRKHTPLAS